MIKLEEIKIYLKEQTIEMLYGESSCFTTEGEETIYESNSGFGAGDA